MAEISMKEFCKSPKKWMEESPLVVTVYGKARYWIYSQEKVKVEKLSKEEMPKLIEKAEDVAKVTDKAKRMGEYGCGCEKETGKVFCSKHGRL